jgi:hypothetical protein
MIGSGRLDQVLVTRQRGWQSVRANLCRWRQIHFAAPFCPKNQVHLLIFTHRAQLIMELIRVGFPKNYENLPGSVIGVEAFCIASPGESRDANNSH